MSVPLSELLITENASIREALEVINRNALGTAFVIDSNGKLCGVVTDGDIRRSLLKGITISANVSTAMTRNCVSLPATTSHETLLDHFGERIRLIPLLDSVGRPIDYASRHRFHRIPVMEPLLSGNELNYVVECIQTNWISSKGAFVKKFETEFASYIGAQNALAVSNGTVALHLALRALDIGPGDEVIVPDLTFAASINAILYVGATPVLVDVKEDTWNIDPEATARAITPRTKAIMPVHLYGQPAEMSELKRLAKEHNLLIIEDAAEALGAIYCDQPVGTLGDAATFSFFGNKLITTGEGGMVVFRDPAIAARAKMLRDHGMDPNCRYWHLEVGYNYRLTNLQAAVGVAQLEQIDTFIERKLAVANHYRQELAGLPGITLPVERQGIRNIYWLFSFLFDGRRLNLNRDNLQQELATYGIETRPLFFPLHTMPPYQKYAKNGHFPNAIRLSAQGLSLPSAVTLTNNEVEKICTLIKKVLLA